MNGFDCKVTDQVIALQIGQFLLDDFLLSQEDHRYIICTQPRRISAVAVAQRVADERDEKVGLSVGYQVIFNQAFIFKHHSRVLL